MPTATSTSKRDLRLDLFRGLANFAIFLDHVPNNVAAWLTARNYGFSDAADLFVFVSGYTVAFVYAKQMQVRGFVFSAINILGRAWQIYVAHVLAFVFYVVVVGYVAQRFEHAHLLDEFNIRRLIADPIEFLKHGLLLEFKPLNLDVLPLYVVLMASFPPLLWLLVRTPRLAVLFSFLLYTGAWVLGWNLPAYPTGSWYFNPFAWQFLFVIGAWIALGGANDLARTLNSSTVLIAAILFLLVACIVTLAPRVGLDDWLPDILKRLFTLNDKTNLAPQRIIHFLALALIVTRAIPRGARGLDHAALRPIVVCGQRSLEVFCSGLFLSFVAYIAIEVISSSPLFHLAVSAMGIAIMIAVAYFRTWVKSQREARST